MVSIPGDAAPGIFLPEIWPNPLNVNYGEPDYPISPGATWKHTLFAHRDLRRFRQKCS